MQGTQTHAELGINYLQANPQVVTFLILYVARHSSGITAIPITNEKYNLNYITSLPGTHPPPRAKNLPDFLPGPG